MPENLEIERPPHFRQSPEQRTRSEEQLYPVSDFPSAEEVEDYTDIAQPLTVDAGAETVHENLDWSANRVHVDFRRMVRLTGRNPNRRRLVIRNDTDDKIVYLGRNQTDSIFAMMLLEGPSTTTSANSEAEMFHQGEVWAICDGADEVDLSVFQEFLLRED